MLLTNEFIVPSRPDVAWQYLIDVPRVISCIPGAELIEEVSDEVCRANMRVKLGPISLQFALEINRTAMDGTNHHVRFAVSARELRGRGSAQARVESILTPIEDGARVVVSTDVTLRGAVAQYGGGVVEDVSAEITRDFSDCLAARMNRSPAAADSAELVAPIEGLRLGARIAVRRLMRLWSRLRR